MTLFWLIVIVLAVVIAVCYFKCGKKKGSNLPQKPQGPRYTPPSPPPPPPPSSMPPQPPTPPAMQ